MNVKIIGHRGSPKKAIENMFKAKVEDVRTYVRSGEKRAYVKFSNESPAIDIATQLGLM